MAKTFVITAPNGKKYKVTGEGTKEEALQHLQQQLGGAAGQPAPEPPPIAEQTLPTDRPMPMGAMADPNLVPRISPMAAQTRREFEAIGLPGSWGEGLNATREALQSQLTVGWGEEGIAAAKALPQAVSDWRQGKGWDFSKYYSPEQQRQEEYTLARRQRNPVISAIAEPIGALAGGMVLGGAGLTTAGRAVPYLSKVAPGIMSTIMSGLEGMGWAGTQAAGEAPPGQRLEAAKKAAPVGAVTGGLLQGTSNVLDKPFDIAANRAALKAAPAAGTELTTAGQKLYKTADDSGIRYQPEAVDRLRVNIRAGADLLNRDLAPKTLGLVKDANKRFDGSRSVSFKEFHKYQNQVNAAIRKADDTDLPTLYAIRDATEDFAKSIQPGDFTGGDAKLAMQLKKEGDVLYAQGKQTLEIEQIMDRIQRKASGRMTQGGLVQATRSEMESLLRRIENGQARGYNPEQISLIRQMAMGGSHSKMVRLLSLFDPTRGPVAATAGLFFGGPPTWTAGYLANRARERGMEQAADLLLSSATRRTPVKIKTPPRNIAPLIPAATLLLSGNKERRQGDRKR